MAEHPEESSGLIKTPKQLVIVVIIALFLPVAIAVMFSQLAVRGLSSKDLSEESVARRIQPVAQVALASAAGGEKAGQSSEDVYKASCAACHDTGVADSPKTGDKAAWAARIGVGLEKLSASGIKGKGAMPPKGGTDLSTADFTRVVAWMANKSGASFKEPASPMAQAPVAATPATPEPLAAATPAAAPAPAAAAGAGKKVYDMACMACHAAAVAGAPKLGDKAAWAPRLAAGIDGLTASVIKGKGAMPPKGGNASIPDADIKAAVEYMTASVK